MKIKKQFKDLSIGDSFTERFGESGEISGLVYEKIACEYDVENIKSVNRGITRVWWGPPANQDVFHIVSDIVDLI